MLKTIKKIIVSILTWEAKVLLKRKSPIIIGITGSVGKTTTKEYIARGLRSRSVGKSEKSLNSEFGVPLSILGLKTGWRNPILWTYIIVVGFLKALFQKKYPEILVLEMGLEYPGDIEKIVKWLNVDIAILTGLSDIPVHVENFKDKEHLYQEKGKIFSDKNKLVIYDSENRNSCRIVDNLKTKKESIENVKIESIKHIVENRRLKGISVWIDGVEFKVLGTAAKYYAKSIAFAVVVGKQFGLNTKEIEENIKGIEPTNGRMRILDGMNNSTIIDDTYNASPVAMNEAISSIKDLEYKHKVAVVGAMAQLGEFKEEAESKTIDNLEKNFDVVIVVGENLYLTTEKGMVVKNHKEAIDILKKTITKDTLVFLKGSQVSRMEKVVKEILDSKLNPKDVLVRQESYWKNN